MVIFFIPVVIESISPEVALLAAFVAIVPLAFWEEDDARGKEGTSCLLSLRRPVGGDFLLARGFFAMSERAGFTILVFLTRTAGVA